MRINSVFGRPAQRLFALTGLLFFNHALSDQALFDQHCGACHTLDTDSPQRQGPSLKNLIGRKAGSVEGFPYSSTLQSLDVTWSAETIDQWLVNPQEMAADSYMMYRQPDADIRAGIVMFLGTR